MRSMRASLMRISSPSREISCRSRLFSALSRMRAFQLLTDRLRDAVKEKCASEMAWMEDLGMMPQTIHLHLLLTALSFWKV